MPNGQYIASGGCNGILSWFDGDGSVLVQSLPHEGVGLETAYSHELQVLPDGRTLVRGGPGLVAYSTAGELLWKLEGGYSQFHCDPASGVLIGCHWQKHEPNGPNRTYLEALRGV